MQGAMGMGVCLYTHKCIYKSKHVYIYVLQQMQGAMGMGVGSMGGMGGGGGQGNLLWMQEQHAALHQLSKMQVGFFFFGGWGGGSVGGQLGGWEKTHTHTQTQTHTDTHIRICIHTYRRIYVYT